MVFFYAVMASWESCYLSIECPTYDLKIIYKSLIALIYESWEATSLPVGEGKPLTDMFNPQPALTPFFEGIRAQ